LSKFNTFPQLFLLTLQKQLLAAIIPSNRLAHIFLFNPQNSSHEREMKKKNPIKLKYREIYFLKNNNKEIFLVAFPCTREHSNNNKHFFLCFSPFHDLISLLLFIP